MDTPPQWPAGQILQHARETAGLSKRETARRAKIAASFYGRIENGGHTTNGKWIPVNPSADTITACANAVNTDPQALLSAAGFDLTDIQRKTLHDIVEGLPDTKLPAAVALLEQL